MSFNSFQSPSISLVAVAILLLSSGSAVSQDQAGGGFGRYFLARCAEDTIDARRSDWSIYTRRPLICAGAPTAMMDQAGSIWDLFVGLRTDLAALLISFDEILSSLCGLEVQCSREECVGPIHSRTFICCQIIKLEETC